MSYYYTAYTCLFLSVAILPAGYILLCRKMTKAAIPNPPAIPFFCVFGTVGGYLLIAALSPSVFTLLVLPWTLFAPIALIISLVYVVKATPQTAYHSGAIICCLILLFLICLPFLAAILKRGAW